NLPQDLGKVYCSENSGGVEICHKLLRNNSNFIINQKLDIIDVMELSEERKKYLYQKIRQYVEDPYKDIYYL
ncbi:11812_t:CDS:1, partial [Funneliformis geosporum]